MHLHQVYYYFRQLWQLYAVSWLPLSLVAKLSLLAKKCNQSISSSVPSFLHLPTEFPALSETHVCVSRSVCAYACGEACVDCVRAHLYLTAEISQGHQPPIAPVVFMPLLIDLQTDMDKIIH